MYRKVHTLPELGHLVHLHGVVFSFQNVGLPVNWRLLGSLSEIPAQPQFGGQLRG